MEVLILVLLWFCFGFALYVLVVSTSPSSSLRPGEVPWAVRGCLVGSCF